MRRYVVTVGMITALAACGGTSSSPPAPGSGPSLYVAARDRVNVFPAGADGTAAPSRTIANFYQTSGSDPNGIQTAEAAAIATGADGTLQILENVGPARPPDYIGCRSVLESATANGSNGLIGTFPCNGAHGTAVARGTNGEFVALLFSATGSNFDVVERRLNGTVVGAFSLGGIGYHRAVSVASDGGIYVASNIEFVNPASSNIFEYASNSGNPPAIIRQFQLPGIPTSMTVAPDGTVYVATDLRDASGSGTSFIYAIAPGQADKTPASRAIGPFTNIIGALACGDQNELYAAINPRAAGRTSVNTYDSRAFGQATPLHVLQDPIPPDDSAGNAIVGLAFSR
jgi:hypothetical protein